MPFGADPDLGMLRDRPAVREALFLAGEPPAGLRRVVSTPAAEGLSGGWTTGELGEATRLELPPAAGCRRHTRLDPDFLVALTSALARDPTLSRRLLHRPSSSLYRASRRLRYLESHRVDDLRGYRLVAVETGELLDDLLDLAEPGATLDALAASLAEADPDVSHAEALDFVTELAQAQILVPDLSPPVTGDEPLADVLRQLAAHTDDPAAAAAHQRLARVRDALARLDDAGPGAPPEAYREIEDELRSLPGAEQVPPRFHVDLVKPAAATLGPEPLREIARAVALIERLPHHSPKRALELFRDAFRERWGEGREVPLGLALDPEVGLPFRETLPPDGPRPQPLPRWLERRLDRALARGEHEVFVTDEEIEPCDPAAPLPDAFHVRVRLAAVSAEAIDRGDFRLCIMGLAGPAGARLLGRLCHADPALARHVERHLAQEAALSPDAVFAEIVHLPEGRPGVSVSRPRLTEYEIVYQGKGAAGPEHRIPVSDLRLSVQGDEIRLRSARLGRRVVPRLSAGHFVGGSNQPIYRFLGALQNHGVRGGWTWSWGERQGEAFLPRVRCGRWIMTRARWRVPRTEVDQLAALPAESRPAAVAAWRAERRLPPFPAFDDREYELALDLESPAGIDAFLAVAQDSLRVFDHVVLTELFPPPDQLAVRGSEGGFISELIVPFVRGGS